jgi:hypothetical protein
MQTKNTVAISVGLAINAFQPIIAKSDPNHAKALSAKLGRNELAFFDSPSVLVDQSDEPLGRHYFFLGELV